MNQRERNHILFLQFFARHSRSGVTWFISPTKRMHTFILFTPRMRAQFLVMNTCKCLMHTSFLSLFISTGFVLLQSHAAGTDRCNQLSQLSASVLRGWEAIGPINASTMLE